ncbi:MAG: ester cyclase [Bacteroidales bacterium]|nr:ester cyclase [Bacteroidales bacterium]MCF6342696.1 ester cyclase [Bacteroidales bacterium]
MNNTNKNLVRSFADAGNSNNLNAFDTLLTPDFARHCEATPEVTVNSCEDFKQFYRETEKTFPDQQMNLDRLVAEGDFVAFWGNFSGTQKGPMGPFPPTGKRMVSEIAGMFRIENGKIAELWVTWDNLSGLMQLGLLPPNPA